MIIALLSYFDNLFGPKIVLKFPDSTNAIGLEQIPFLMDLYKEGFFIHEFDKLKTANFIFDIHSPIARGKADVLMISVVSFDEAYNLNLNSFREIMEFFVKKFKNIKDLYRMFHVENARRNQGAFQGILNLLNLFYQSLPDERAISKQIMSKILTYGLSQAGKQNIINFLDKKFSQTLNHSGEFSLKGNFGLN